MSKVKCLHCKDVIESKHRHDFVTCNCRKVSVDGGTDYLRILGEFGDFKILNDSEEETKLTGDSNE